MIYFKEFSFWIYRNEKRVAKQKSTQSTKHPDTEINIVGKWNVDLSPFSFPYEPERHAQNNIRTSSLYLQIDRGIAALCQHNWTKIMDF